MSRAHPTTNGINLTSADLKESVAHNSLKVVRGAVPSELLPG